MLHPPGISVADPVMWSISRDWIPSTNTMNVIGLGCTVVLIYIVAWLLNKPRRLHVGEDAMVRHFRDARVRFIVGELITEGVEEAVFKEKLTRPESIDIYTKIGQAFNLVDLLPKRKPKQKLSRGEVEHLKSQIKERIASQTVDNVVPMPKKRVLGKGYKS